MNIGDIIYFSPNFRMDQLDFNNKEQIIEAFKDRIQSYYLEPIKLLNDSKSAYASGIILLSLVDAMARYSSLENCVNKRIKFWLSENIQSMKRLPSNDIEKVTVRIYEDFRCGLLHESHIKNCGQFSYETGESVIYEKSFIIINPKHFYEEIKAYFEKFIKELSNDSKLYDVFIERIKRDFEKEVKTFKKHYRR